MNFTSFVKSEFGALGIQEVLKASPIVLLGVSPEIEATLATARIKTVFDLALSTLFANASRIVENSSDVGSTYRKFGRAPASVIDQGMLTVHPVTSLPLEELKTLIGIGAPLQAQMVSRLSIAVVRDLALWPPYLAAKAIVVEAYNPSLSPAPDAEAPKELIPASGEFGTERHLYSSVVMFPGAYDVSQPLSNTLFDVAAASLTGFTRMRFGARLTYSQVWFPKFVAKGQLLHSLPLAPGESTNIAVIDWTNKSKASTQQSVSESERLYSTNDRTRSVSQIATSVANDFESGSSQTFGQSASASAGGAGVFGLSFVVGFASASGSANESSSSTHTVSTGTRDIATTLHQNIVDSTQQNSSAVRSQRAAVVSEVSQSDRKNLSTRNITNYNHMHALTVQYYEVVQIYDTQVRIEDAERCIFIPMALFDFKDERIIFRYLSILKRVALSYNTGAMLREVEGNRGGYTLSWGVNRLPTGAPTGLTPWAVDVAAGYRFLDNRGFIKAPATGNPSQRVNADLKVNFELQLNNVIVLNSRSTAPRSMVTGVDIDLEDGGTISLTTPAPAALPGPDVINPAFGGVPISFGKVRAIRLRTRSYTPGVALNAHIARVMLAVKLNGESRFLDASFVIGGTGSSYNGTHLLTLAGLPEMALLEQDLMDHQLYYSQRIWLQENPQNIVTQFAPLTLTLGGQTINLVDYITPLPVKVVGNYLVYKFTFESDPEWQAWLDANVDRSRVLSDAVAVPTGGVFAEAVLGRFNAAEKLDITRFANWTDSPPPKPPEISAVKFTDPGPPTLPGQATFAAPIVSIQTPMPLPSPSGLTDVLASIVKGGSFPDVSGLVPTGDAAVKATELASANSVAAMKANGEAFAQLLTSLSNVLQTAVSKEATKTLSDVGALLNKKDGEKKEDGATDDKESGDATPGDGGSPIPRGSTTREARLVDDAISGSALASLASGLGADVATDAPPAGIPTLSGDQALVKSSLVTDPFFSDVTGFLVLLQLIPDENLLDVLQERFSNLDETIDPKAKFTELSNEFTANSARLTGGDRMLFALRFQKESILPDTSTLDQTQIRRVKELAVEKMSNRAFTVARRVFNSNDAKDVMKQICLMANDAGLLNINHLAYALATAYHESAMGKFMTEIANGVSTDTVFTKDEYFFDAIAGKKNSYNGINGNLLAGNQLQASGVIAAGSDVALWNGSVYPNAQPTAEKLAARACDFYRFIGRGLVQITGRTNYGRYRNRAEFGNIDFLADPERVADADIAAAILVRGMNGGDFRGHRLSDYDTAAGFDGLNARDIVNGDIATKGARIRDLAIEFKTSLVINSKLDESSKIV